MVPAEVRAEIGAELDSLIDLGYRVRGGKYKADSFGDWFVDLAGPRSFRIVKDRGQFRAAAGPAERQSLESHGLRRVYDDREEFFCRLLEWAAR